MAPPTGAPRSTSSLWREPISAVLEAAFNDKHPHALAFEKRYDGWNLDQGLGGYSRDLRPDAPYWGPLRVAWNVDLNRYQAFINNGNLIAYAESPDGLSWSVPTVLKDFSTDPNQPAFYVTPIGLGEEPHILGKQFSQRRGLGRRFRTSLHGHVPIAGMRAFMPAAASRRLQR